MTAVIISNWHKNNSFFKPRSGSIQGSFLGCFLSYRSPSPGLLGKTYIFSKKLFNSSWFSAALKNITDNFKPQVHCFGHCWKVPLCCAPSMLVSNISSIFIMSFIWIILTHPQYWSANQYQHHHKKDYCASFFPMICTQKLKANFLAHKSRLSIKSR